MSDKILNIIEEAITEVETRLKRCPPALQKGWETKPEHLPPFFEGMPHYAAAIFPPTLREYLAAFSAVPVAVFRLPASSLLVHSFSINYENRQGAFKTWEDPWLSAQSSHEGFSESERGSVLSWSRSGIVPEAGARKISFMQWLYTQNTDTARRGPPPPSIPKSFTSLDLYSFFKEKAALKVAVRVSAEGLLPQIVEAARQLDTSQQTREGAFQVASGITGLSPNNSTLSALIDAWGLCARVGIYANDDERLANVFFTAVKKCGHLGEPRFVNQEVHKTSGHLLDDSGRPRIKTPGSVPIEMRKIIGNLYDEMMGLVKMRRPGESHLIQAIPVDPSDIKAVDTKSTDIHQVIEKEIKRRPPPRPGRPRGNSGPKG